MPTCAASGVFCSVCAPRTSPRSVSSGPASATVRPMSGGTAAWSGPLPTCSVTVLPSGTWVPAAGSVPMTLPLSSRLDVTSCSVASRFASCSAARAASGCCPARFGTSTCCGAGDPEYQITGQRQQPDHHRGRDADRDPLAPAPVRIVVVVAVRVVGRRRGRRGVAGGTGAVDPPGLPRGARVQHRRALVLAHHHRRERLLPRPHPHQVRPHLGGGLVAVGRVLAQRLEHDRIELRGDLRVELRRGPRVLPHVLVGHRDRGVAGERRLAGEQLEQHATGGVDVAAGVDGLTARLLGRQVLRRPDHRGGLGHVLALTQRAGDAEVHDLHRTGPVDHDVGRLHVAVDDAVLVAEVERGAHVGHHLDDPLLAHRARGLDDLAQRLPVDVLHDDVGQRAEVAGDLAGVIDRDDRGMVERRGVLRLAAEPRWNWGSRAKSARSTFTATSRPRRLSRPRCTSDIPP